MPTPRGIVPPWMQQAGANIVGGVRGIGQNIRRTYEDELNSVGNLAREGYQVATEGDLPSAMSYGNKLAGMSSPSSVLGGAARLASPFVGLTDPLKLGAAGLAGLTTTPATANRNAPPSNPRPTPYGTVRAGRPQARGAVSAIEHEITYVKQDENESTIENRLNNGTGQGDSQNLKKPVVTPDIPDSLRRGASNYVPGGAAEYKKSFQQQIVDHPMDTRSIEEMPREKVYGGSQWDNYAATSGSQRDIDNALRSDINDRYTKEILDAQTRADLNDPRYLDLKKAKLDADLARARAQANDPLGIKAEQEKYSARNAGKQAQFQHIMDQYQKRMVEIANDQTMSVEDKQREMEGLEAWKTSWAKFINPEGERSTPYPTSFGGV